MKKRVLTTILAGVLAVSAFAGCGSSNTAGNAAADNNAAAETNEQQKQMMQQLQTPLQQKVKHPRA